MIDNNLRLQIATLTLSAMGFGFIVSYEGYTPTATIPIKGDVPTIGFGTTHNVKMGDKTDPVKAVQRAILDAQKHEAFIKKCVKVPLSQGEYDAYVSLAYNIGTANFCSSTLVKLLNQEKYVEACEQILRWNCGADPTGKYSQQATHNPCGKNKAPIPGLVNRRQSEFQQCIDSAKLANENNTHSH